MHFVFNVFVVFFNSNMLFIFTNNYNLNVTAVTRFEVFHSGETMLYCGLLATSDTSLKTIMTGWYMLAYSAYVGVHSIPVSYCINFERCVNMADSVLLQCLYSALGLYSVKS